MYAKVINGQFVEELAKLPDRWVLPDGSTILGSLESYPADKLLAIGIYKIEEINADYDPKLQKRSDPDVQVLADKVTYTYTVTDLPPPTPTPPEVLNLLFVRRTDWIVLRHIEEKSLNITTTLTDQEYIALLQERRTKSKDLDAGQQVEDAGGTSIPPKP